MPRTGGSRRKKRTLRYKLVMENIVNMLETALKEGIRCNIKRVEELGFQARRLSQSFNVRIPKKYKYFYCKRCKNLLIPGKTMIVRVRQNRFPHISIICTYCRSIKRIPIRK